MVRVPRPRKRVSAPNDYTENNTKTLYCQHHCCAHGSSRSPHSDVGTAAAAGSRLQALQGSVGEPKFKAAGVLSLFADVILVFPFLVRSCSSANTGCPVFQARFPTPLLHGLVLSQCSPRGVQSSRNGCSARQRSCELRQNRDLQFCRRVCAVPP